MKYQYFTPGMDEKQIKEAGFSRVRTFAGSVAVDDWTPYGVKDKFIGLYMEVEGDKVVEFNKKPQYADKFFVFGCWPLEA